MAETKRLDSVVECPNCFRQVNPPILETLQVSLEDSWDSITKVQCPTCGRSWRIYEKGNEMDGWFVFDPSPVDTPEPKLYGMFATQEEAEQYANILHDLDGSGQTVVLQLTQV